MFHLLLVCTSNKLQYDILRMIPEMASEQVQAVLVNGVLPDLETNRDRLIKGQLKHINRSIRRSKPVHQAPVVRNAPFSQHTVFRTALPALRCQLALAEL